MNAYDVPGISSKEMSGEKCHGKMGGFDTVQAMRKGRAMGET